MKARDVYYGSDPTVTKAYYRQLLKAGPMGQLAVHLFRAQKASARAKQYKGGPQPGLSFKRLSYGRKTDSLSELSNFLVAYASTFGIKWGWKRDRKAVNYEWVLYVDLPQGQVSFHSPHRYKGPDYNKEWDGHVGFVASRIIEFCDTVLGWTDPQQPSLLES